jgi:hypothetical protein
MDAGRLHHVLDDSDRLVSVAWLIFAARQPKGLVCEEEADLPATRHKIGKAQHELRATCNSQDRAGCGFRISSHEVPRHLDEAGYGLGCRDDPYKRQRRYRGIGDDPIGGSLSCRPIRKPLKLGTHRRVPPL